MRSLVALPVFNEASSVDEVLDEVFDLFPDLREIQQRRGGVLSGGQQQMLTIARSLMGNPRLLPEEFRARAQRLGSARTIADYIAGMTDRYAIQEYERLFDPAVRA